MGITLSPDSELERAGTQNDHAHGPDQFGLRRLFFFSRDTVFG
jgi:hypothetical protein